MSFTHTAAKAAFWIGIAFLFIAVVITATGTPALIGGAIIAMPLIAPYLYLNYKAGRRTENQDGTVVTE